MSIPRKKHTKSAVGTRRSQDAIKTQTLNKCPKCGKAVQPHHACGFCGSYKGKDAVKVKVKSTTKKTK